jgi:hypothetical protein
MAAVAGTMNTALWRLLVAVCAVASVWCGILLARTPASYSTGYDGTDPSVGKCAQGAGVAPIIAQAPLFGDNGQRVGTLRLRRSSTCFTSWGQVVLTAGAAKQLRGRKIEVIASRPADNRNAVYERELTGNNTTFGNQLGVTACVRATARILASGGRSAGAQAATDCIAP